MDIWSIIGKYHNEAKLYVHVLQCEIIPHTGWIGRSKGISDGTGYQVTTHINITAITTLQQIYKTYQHKHLSVTYILIIIT